MQNHANLLTILASKFQLHAFREGQLEAIEAILSGSDVLCVMPTGYGKSLCYQMAAQVLDGITVVVSPLVALMKDQVDALHRKGFHEATFINSSLTIAAQQERLQSLHSGKFKLIYISPERFRSHAFLRALNAASIQLFVIDEAHCISQWGHDFRPDYLSLHEAIAKLGRPPIAAFTATATREVRDDIKKQLGIQSAREFVHSVARESLEFFVFPVSNDEEKLMWIQHLAQSITGKGIIYCGRRRECEQVNEFLHSIGMNSEYFHAGRPEPKKKEIQERFMDDRHSSAVDIIASTNAFGLGVDKANIRFIIHSAIPGTVEEYFQEAGRSGRDGKRSFCILLYTYDDRSLQEWFIENCLVSREQLIEIYETINGAAAVENYRIVKYDEIFWFVDLDETKTRVGISHLERLGMLRRLADVDATMTIGRLFDNEAAALEKLSPEIHQGKLRIITTILTMAGTATTLDLPEFCNHHKFNLMSVIETLYDLEFERLIQLRRAGHAMVFKIDKPVHALRKLRMRELGLEEYREHRYHKLEQMLSYAESKTCRLRFIREYFGEKVANDCGRCDNCRIKNGWQPPKLIRPPTIIADATIDYFNEKLLHLAILVTVRAVDGRVGKNVVADILKGSRSKLIKSLQFDKLKTYGKLPYFRKEALIEVIKLLILQGLIEEKRPFGFDFPVVTLSPSGTEFLQQDEAKIEALPPLPDLDHLARADQAIVDALKKIQPTGGDRAGFFTLHFLPMKTLKEIANLKPRSLAHLSFIRGISDAKLARYGEAILKILASYVRQPATGDGKIPDQEFIAVKKFIRGQLSHALHGDFDVGFALANHTEIHDGKRDYTPIGKMVFEFKYQGKRSQLDPLMHEVVRFINENESYKNADLIVPVPSTSKDRDYDPITLIAQVMSERTGIAVARNVLVKTRVTPPQKQLVNLTQKKLNVKNAFKITEREKIHRKTIILLDDLYDSGATLNECSRLLRNAGAEKVLAFALTRTVHST